MRDSQGCHVRFRARYGESDQMGVIYNANYFDWFTEGRTEWFRSIGLSYRDMEEQGILLPVLEAHCTYRVSARFDDLIHLIAVPDHMTPTRLRFRYQIFREEKEGKEVFLAEGWTEHAFMDPTGKPFNLRKRTPSVWKILSSEILGTRS